MQEIRIIRFFREWIFVLAVAFCVCLVPEVSQAQPKPEDVLMTPQVNETAGKVERGELLITSLKRENVDPVSAKQAIQSLGGLFDFRLTRAGDRYVFRLNSAKKLTLLRYQRHRHIYEAVWNPEIGQFESRMIDTADLPPVPENPAPEEVAVVPVPDEAALPAAPVDEDGEIDVEREAMAPQANVERIDVPDDAVVMDAQETVEQPVDEALIGRESPDPEFPQRPGFDPSFDAAFDHHAAIPGGSDEALDVDVPTGISDVPQDMQVLPGTSIPVVEPSDSVPQKRYIERESVVFSTVSIVMFFIGLILFVFAMLTSIIPAVRLHRRAQAEGIAILDRIRISPRETLAQVSVDGHACLVAFHSSGVSFIAPCPPDDEELWAHLKAKTDWYKMSQSPISDRQLRELVDAFHDSRNAEPEVIEDEEKSEVADPVSSADSRCISMSDLMVVKLEPSEEPEETK